MLVRYSGTEPLLRIMLEGRDRDEITRLGERDRRNRETGTRVTARCARHGRTEARSTAQPVAPQHCTEMINLSVNINKVATVRNSRGGTVPSVIEAAEVCIDAGVQGITVHPRADAASHHVRRCPRARSAARAAIKRRVEFNIEGDPRPDLLDLVREVRPDQCTLVPVAARRGHQPGGLAAGYARSDEMRQRGRATCSRVGVRVSMFVDPELRAD